MSSAQWLQVANGCYIEQHTQVKMIRKYFCIFTKGIGLNVSYQYKYSFIGIKNNINNFNSILEKINRLCQYFQ